MDSGRITSHSLGSSAVITESEQTVTQPPRVASSIASVFPTLPSELSQRTRTSPTTPVIADVLTSCGGTMIPAGAATAQTSHKENESVISASTTDKQMPSSVADVMPALEPIIRTGDVQSQTHDTPYTKKSRVNSLPVLSHFRTPTATSDATDDSSHVRRQVRGLLTQSKSQSELSCNTQTSSDEDIGQQFDLTVMLQRGDVINVPHTVHCVKVMQQVYLMIVCEVSAVRRTSIIYM